MSIETKTSQGEKISWRLFPNKFGEMTEVHIGNYEFNRVEFSIGMLQFLYGAKHIQIGSVGIKIPEKTSDVVEFGHLILHYSEFVDGFAWNATNTGGYAEEHQIPLSSIQCIAIDALREKLLEKLPETDERGLNIAKELKEAHERPGGIYGIWQDHPILTPVPRT